MLHRAPRVVLNLYHYTVVSLERIFNSIVAWPERGIGWPDPVHMCTPNAETAYSLSLPAFWTIIYLPLDQQVYSHDKTKPYDQK